MALDSSSSGENRDDLKRLVVSLSQSMTDGAALSSNSTTEVRKETHHQRELTMYIAPGSEKTINNCKQSRIIRKQYKMYRRGPSDQTQPIPRAVPQ